MATSRRSKSQGKTRTSRESREGKLHDLLQNQRAWLLSGSLAVLVDQGEHQSKLSYCRAWIGACNSIAAFRCRTRD